MKEGVWCVEVSDYEGTFTVALFTGKEEAEKAAKWCEKEYSHWTHAYARCRTLETAKGFIERLTNVPW